MNSTKEIFLAGGRDTRFALMSAIGVGPRRDETIVVEI